MLKLISTAGAYFFWLLKMLRCKKIILTNMPCSGLKQQNSAIHIHFKNYFMRSKVKKILEREKMICLFQAMVRAQENV